MDREEMEQMEQKFAAMIAKLDTARAYIDEHKDLFEQLHSEINDAASGLLVAATLDNPRLHLAWHEAKVLCLAAAQWGIWKGYTYPKVPAVFEGGER